MISCAAIQKLERYGQLGLKRSTVEDFVLSSLKDPKRANVYALTHLDTWRECADAICGTHFYKTSTSEAEVSDHAPSVAFSAPPARVVTVSESLLYAMSFATALISHHVHRTLTTSAVSSTETVAAATRGASAAAAATATTTGAVFEENDLSTATELLTLLEHIALCIAGGEGVADTTPSSLVATTETDVAAKGRTAMGMKSTPTVRVASSPAATQAIAHGLSTATDLALFIIACSVMEKTSAAMTAEGKRSSQSGQPTEEASTSAAGSVSRAVSAMAVKTAVILASLTRLLRRAMAVCPVSSLFHVRTCPAQLKQALHKQSMVEQQRQKEQHATGAKDAAHRRSDGDPRERVYEVLAAAMESQSTAPVLRIVVESAVRGSFGVFEGFSLFQKLSLLHSVVGAAEVCPAHQRSGLQRLICQLLAPIVCNRATRYVVYYRGDDLKLMQNNVRQASDYALHTYSTTAPAEEALVSALTASLAHPNSNVSSATASSASKTETSSTDAQRRCALLLAQWVTSAVLLFQSFCTDSSWTAFAQEQRRLVLLRQSQEKRGRREERRRRKEDGAQRASASRSGSVSSAASSQNGADSEHGDGGASEKRPPSGLIDQEEEEEEDDTRSVNTAAGRYSLLSMESRASMLSTLSKASAQSYLSFLSVLQPENGEAEGGNAHAVPQLHESEDGNTNLPLILLEELVLALYTFMESIPAAVLDGYGLRALCWQVIGQLFHLVQLSITAHESGSVNTATGTIANRRSGAEDEENDEGASRDGAELARPSSLSAATNGMGRPALTAENVNTAAAPLFSLGEDIRYNHGRGYECLGLLFAKVVAPQLEGTSTMNATTSTSEASPANVAERRPHTNVTNGTAAASVVTTEKGSATMTTTTNTAFNNLRGRPSITSTDAASTRHCVEAALSACLSAYETVAPQVVDMNMRVILCIAARTAWTLAAQSDGVEVNRTPLNVSSAPRAVAVGNAVAAPASLEGSSVLFDFLAEVTLRLGKSNLVPRLLDALVAHRDADASTATMSTKASVDADGGDDDGDDVAALQLTFAHPTVRQALVTACALSLDPENLLARLLRYVRAWCTVDEEEVAGEGVDSTTSRYHQPLHVLFILQLVATVLEGIEPSSVVASAVLERSTELELLLVMLVTNHLVVDGGDAAEKTKNENEDPSLFAPGTVRPKLRRRLLLHALYALYQCREVTRACLHDLGMQNVHAFIGVLEDSLWQVGSHVGDVVGNQQMAEVTSWLTSTTHMPYAPYVQAAALLPRLAAQRLSLARAVCGLLGTEAGPASEAKYLAHYVLNALSGVGSANEEADCCVELTPTQRGRVLALANALTEEEWRALLTYAKPKHVRRALVRLLQLTFADDVAHQCGLTSAAMTENEAQGTRSAVGTDGAAASRDVAVVSSSETALAVWLTRCTRCIGGATLRAITDVMLSFSSKDVVHAAEQHKRGRSDDEEGEEGVDSPSSTSQLQTILIMVSALKKVYREVGHVPYWPALLQQSVTWLLALSESTAAAEASSPRTSAGAGHHVGQLVQALLELVLHILSCESRCSDVLKRVLARDEAAASAEEPTKPATISDSTEPLAKDAAAASRSAASTTNSKGWSASYVDCIGVPMATLEELEGARGRTTASTASASSLASNAEDADGAMLVVNEQCFEEQLCQLCRELFATTGVDAFFRLLPLVTPPHTVSPSAETRKRASLSVSEKTGAPMSSAASSACAPALAVLAQLYGIALSAVPFALRANPPSQAGSPRRFSPLRALHYLQAVADAFTRAWRQRTTTTTASAAVAERSIECTAVAQWIQHFVLSRCGPLVLHIATNSGRSGRGKLVSATPADAPVTSAQQSTPQPASVMAAVEDSWMQLLRVLLHWILAKRTNAVAPMVKDGAVPAATRKTNKREKKGKGAPSESQTSAVDIQDAHGEGTTVASQPQLLATLLDSCNALYAAVRSSFTKARPQSESAAHRGRKGAAGDAGSPRGVKRERDADGDGDDAQDKGETTTASASSSSSSGSFVSALLTEAASSTQPSLRAALTTLFTGASDEAAVVSLKESVTTMTELLADGGAAGVSTLWILFHLWQEDVRRYGSALSSQRPSSRGHVSSPHATSLILSVVLAMFDPQRAASSPLSSSTASRQALVHDMVTEIEHTRTVSEQKEKGDDEARNEATADVSAAAAAAAASPQLQPNASPRLLQAAPRPACRAAPCGSPEATQFLLNELHALPTVLHVLHADAAPALLHSYVHRVLSEAVPSPNAVDAWLGITGTSPLSPSEEEARHFRGYALLSAAADALVTFSTVPGMRFSTLKPHLVRLLALSRQPCFLALRTTEQTVSHAPAAGALPRLWTTLLTLCAIPIPALNADDGFLEVVWLFLLSLLETTSTASEITGTSVWRSAVVSAAAAEDGAAQKTSAAGGGEGGIARSAYASRQVRHAVVLTHDEVVAVLSLLSRSWLHSGALWRRPSVLPSALSSLLAVILRGVRDGRYDRRVLNQLSSFFFQLVKHADVEVNTDATGATADLEEEIEEDETKSRQDGRSRRKTASGEGGDGDQKATDAQDAAGSGRPNRTAAPSRRRVEARTAMTTAPHRVAAASSSTRLLCLSAITACLFTTAKHYISVFTAFSSDLDFVAADFLKTLSRQHLPQPHTAPIPHRDGVQMASVGLSSATMADLAFTCVGPEESKALLRQAALRLEEEEEGLVTERRHIFNVE